MTLTVRQAETLRFMDKYGTCVTLYRKGKKYYWSCACMFHQNGHELQCDQETLSSLRRRKLIEPIEIDGNYTDFTISPLGRKALEEYDAQG
jgi:hypothetical protein